MFSTLLIALPLLQNTMSLVQSKAIQVPLQMIKQKTVTTISGKTIPIIADTICIHGDGKHAVAFAKDIYDAIKNEGIGILSRV